MDRILQTMQVAMLMGALEEAYKKIEILEVCIGVSFTRGFQAN